jgi:Putative peptidoglycan binding domain/Peptidase M15
MQASLGGLVGAKPLSGLWHWSSSGPGDGRLAGLDGLCAKAAQAGLDYVAFKSHDGAHKRYLTDAQLQTAKAACARHGLAFVLWQYVYAIVPPRDEAVAFAETIRAFEPPFVFIDVEVEYERADPSVSREYAQAFRTTLPQFPATIAPFGRADLHPRIDYQAWRDHGFGVAPQAYECDSHNLTPAACSRSFAPFWPPNEQWTVVGLHKGSLGQLGGQQLAASLKGLPTANVSGWYSGEFTLDQLRSIATHAKVTPEVTPEPPPEVTPEPPPGASSIETTQRQLVACGFGIAITGQLDPRTVEAIRFFQTGWCGDAPLDADGQLTPATVDALAFSAANRGSLGPRAQNFSYQEFRLDNKGDPRVRRSVGLAAQAYRDKFGPTTIVRSSSTREHNKAVGGAPNSRHLFPDHWDAVDMRPQDRRVDEVTALGVWTGIGHHAKTGLVDHVDLRPGNPSAPTVFPDH